MKSKSFKPSSILTEKPLNKSFVGSRGGGAAHPPYYKVVPLYPKSYPRLCALGPRPLKKEPLVAEGIFARPSKNKKLWLDWRTILILALILLSLWGLMPLDKIKLGLDLKGGMHLVLKVEVDEAIRMRTDRTVSLLKNRCHKTGTRYEKIRRIDIDKIEITGIAVEDHDKVRDLLAIHLPEWSVEVSPQRMLVSLPQGVQTAMGDHCVRQSIETIRNRINTYGLNDSEVQRLGIQGEDRILVTIPDVDDPARVKEILSSTAMLEFKPVKAGPFPTIEAALAQYNGTLPDDLMLFPTNPKRMGTGFYILTAESVISGDDLKSATRGQDEFCGWEVHFSLTPAGAEQFKTYSAANIGQYLAIVFDQKIESAARIDSVLSENTRITGNYSYAEVDDMVLMLQAGTLPASMTPVEERVVGPSLGTDSIKKGITAAAAGLLSVIIFMAVYYRAAGINSIIALILNLLLLMATMTYLGFTLTLPGIAGIILTIGMAVDANVLIFERIKEELKRGAATVSAIAAGFKKALATILDSNITTVIAALFLLQFSAGPIKGFAITLIIGITISMFTALFVSKVIFDLVYVKRKIKGKPVSLNIGLKNPPSKKETAFRFMSKRMRWAGFAFSGLIILAGVVTLFTRGFSLGVDFTGGSMIEVRFKEPITEQNLRTRLREVGLGQASLRRVDKTGNTFFIKTVEPAHNPTAAPGSATGSGNGKGNEYSDATADLVKKAAAPLGKFTILSNETIGPQVGEALKNKTVIVVLGALLGMLVYIGFRFKFSYGLAAVITLIHDILVCLTVLLIWRIEISIPVVAALLTIIGYSLNDTIVIFDRVRDNLKSTRGKTPAQQPEVEKILDRSINQTLSRTLVTSGTTLLAVLAIFFLGGEVLHDFSFILMIGIIFGTYSSIFQSCAWLAVMKA